MLNGVERCGTVGGLASHQVMITTTHDRPTRRRLRVGLSLLCVLLGGSAGQVVAQDDVNPHDGSPAAIRAGRALFTNRCGECHGADATGISGPDLTALWADAGADARVFRTIREGIPGSIMPSSAASDDEVWALVAYLKSIGTVSPMEFATGDATRGRSLFDANCAGCHRAGGAGGRLGPELARVTRTRSRARMVQSIRDPSAAVATGYRAVSVVPLAGETVRGLKKGEDAFSIQIVDTSERLRGFRKADLREVRDETASLMPPFGPDLLRDDEVDDLLRFLASVSEETAR
jgi:putative heme-binding domain-containing protein